MGRDLACPGAPRSAVRLARRARCAHLSETITPRKAQMFFEIAKQSGISSTELAKRCQLTQPKVSAIVWDLGKGDLEVVTSWIPDHPRNGRLHRLSQKGQRALDRSSRTWRNEPQQARIWVRRGMMRGDVFGWPL